MPLSIRAKLSLALSALATACAPGLPSSFPNESAASPDAAEAPPASVGVMLAADPPLPGERAEGWAGLHDAGSGDAPAPMGDHAHHHHNHGAPAPDGGADAGHAHH